MLLSIPNGTNVSNDGENIPKTLETPKIANVRCVDQKGSRSPWTKIHCKSTDVCGRSCGVER